MKKRGISSITVIVILITVILIVISLIIFIAKLEISSQLNILESKIDAISGINLQVSEAVLDSGKLRINVRNTGNQEISSLIVRIVSKNEERILELNEPFAVSENKTILIEAVFGNNASSYTLLEIIPQYTFRGKETTADVKKTNASISLVGGGGGSGGGGSGGENPPSSASPQCTDSIDNDNDNFIDSQDPGCISSDDNSETLENSEFPGMSISELESKFNDYRRLNYNGIYCPEASDAFNTNSSYYLQDCLSSYITMYETTQNQNYIKDALDILENFTSRMINFTDEVQIYLGGKVSYTYLFWPYAEGDDHDNNPSTPKQADCELGTQRGARQFARLARVIKNDAYLNSTYGEKADAIINIIKHDIINHPGCYNGYYPQNGIFHKHSHYSYILLELYLIEGNVTYFNSTLYPNYASLGYLDTITINFNRMKNALFVNPQDSSARVWAATSCTEINYTHPNCYLYDDSVPCKSSGSSYSFCNPGDVSHQENSIEAMVEAYRAGISFSLADIQSLDYTFLHIIWDKNISFPKFHDYVDGKNVAYPRGINGSKKDPWKSGSNFAPGFVELGAFDSETQKVLENAQASYIDDSSWMVGCSLTIPAYYAQLAKNKLAKDCQYTNRAKEICDGIDNDCDGRVDENLNC